MSLGLFHVLELKQSATKTSLYYASDTLAPIVLRLKSVSQRKEVKPAPLPIYPETQPPDSACVWGGETEYKPVRMARKTLGQQRAAFLATGSSRLGIALGAGQTAHDTEGEVTVMQ